MKNRNPFRQLLFRMTTIEDQIKAAGMKIQSVKMGKDLIRVGSSPIAPTSSKDKTVKKQQVVAATAGNTSAASGKTSAARATAQTAEAGNTSPAASKTSAATRTSKTAAAGNTAAAPETEKKTKGSKGKGRGKPAAQKETTASATNTADATTPPNATSDAEKDGVEPPKRMGYELQASDVEMIMNASGPGDIPVKMRNKWYGAIGRWQKLPGCPDYIMHCDNNHESKFRMLQQSAQYKTRGRICRTGVHEKAEEGYTDDKWCWITKYDLYARLHAYHSPEAKEYADSILAQSKPKANPDKRFKMDPKHNLYKVLKEIAEGKKVSGKAMERVEIHEDVEDANKPECIKRALELSKVNEVKPTGTKRQKTHESGFVPASGKKAKTDSTEEKMNAVINMIKEDIACARKTAKQMGKTDGLKFTTELLNTLKDAEMDLKKELDKLTDAQLDGETELFFSLFEDVKKVARSSRSSCRRRG